MDAEMIKGREATVGRRLNEEDLHLPIVGEVYMADTIVFANGDHARFRPVVVVRAPRSAMDYVTFLQRTSTCFHLPGVDHPASGELRLERPGKWIFDYQRSVLATDFIRCSFELRGTIPPAELTRLIAAWEEQP